MVNANPNRGIPRQEPTMSNPNFVNDLVMMAKAFEELPKVQAELESAKHDINGYLATIQRLELRLIDRANEIDNLNAKVRTVEVERDHAETMFLETDGKLDAAKSVLSTLMGNAGAFLQAVEPPKPEPVAEPKFDDGGPYNEPQVQSAVGEPIASDTAAPASAEIAESTSRAGVGSEPIATEQDQREGGPTAHSWAAPISQPSSAPDAGAVSDESAASSTTGESAADPTAVAQSSETGDAVISGTASSSENASASSTTDSSSQKEGSVPSDPTQATESSSESGSSALASPPEPELRYSPEWYQWADAVGYWNRREAAQ
jgi:hypothetical protein